MNSANSDKIQSVWFRIETNSDKYIAMIDYYNKTDISKELKFYTAKFGFLVNGNLRCLEYTIYLTLGLPRSESNELIPRWGQK